LSNNQAKKAEQFAPLSCGTFLWDLFVGLFLDFSMPIQAKSSALDKIMQDISMLAISSVL